jgi:hypothetical protein
VVVRAKAREFIFRLSKRGYIRQRFEGRRSKKSRVGGILTSAMRLLLVEDEARMARFIARGLREQADETA